MNVGLEYLLGFLQDEFRAHPDVRVALLPKAGIKRSVDLPQNYDPETKDLHLLEGVVVRVGGREYFFPSSWVVKKQFGEVQKLLTEIHAFMG